MTLKKQLLAQKQVTERIDRTEWCTCFGTAYPNAQNLTHYTAFQSAKTPPKLPLPMGAFTSPWTNQTQHTKLHLNWLSRFCPAHGRQSLYFTTCVRTRLMHYWIIWVHYIYIGQVLSSSWDGRPFCHNRHGPKIGGLCPFWEEKLGPHVTKCGLGWGLPSYQVASWSIQPLGYNRHGPKFGGCAPCGWSRVHN